MIVVYLTTFDLISKKYRSKKFFRMLGTFIFRITLNIVIWSRLSEVLRQSKTMTNYWWSDEIAFLRKDQTLIELHKSCENCSATGLIRGRSAQLDGEWSLLRDSTKV